MPRYQVTAPDGRTVVLEGDAPPTEADLEQVFAAIPGADSQPSAAAPREMGLLERGMRGPMGSSIIAPDVLKTVAGVGADSAMESGGAAIGQALGAPLAPVTWGGSVLAGRAIGGAIGNLLGQLRRGGDIRPGEMVAAGGMSAIPGVRETRGVVDTLRRGAISGAENIAAQNVATLIDEGDVSSAGQNLMAGIGGVGGEAIASASGRTMQRSLSPDETLNRQRYASFRDLRDEGVVVAPSEVGQPSVLEKFVGKEGLPQAASIRNQGAFQALAREDIGLDKQRLPIAPDDISRARDAASVPYQRVAAISENAAQDLRALKDARSAVRKHRDDWEASEGKNTAARDALEQARARQDELEGTLEVHAKSAQNPSLKDALDQYYRAQQQAVDAERAFADRGGNPGLLRIFEPYEKAQADIAKFRQRVDELAAITDEPELLGELRKARQTYAKTFDVEDSAVRGTGFVDPARLASGYDMRSPLSGNLERIARFRQSFGQNANNAANVRVPGGAKLAGYAAGMSAAQGTPAGAVTAISIPFVSDRIRDYLLSEAYQDELVRRMGTERANQMTELLRRAMIAGGRQGERRDETEDSPIRAALLGN